MISFLLKPECDMLKYVCADCAMECNDMEIGNDLCCSNKEEKCKKQKSEHASLFPFGLATYKMQGDVLNLEM